MNRFGRGEGKAQAGSSGPCCSPAGTWAQWTPPPLSSSIPTRTVDPVTGCQEFDGKGVACPYVGCGESFADHSTIHAQAQKHNLTVNLTTFRVWCYACEKEVFPEQRLAAPLPAASPRLFEQDSPLPSHPLKAVPIAVADEGESESEDDDLKPRGLTGMKNLGNSCYMNAALQALSNCPPLTQFFLECGGLVRTDKKPALCKSYQKLVSEVWHRKRPSYVVPTSLSHGIKLVNPMFRGYAQQDTQEFLRCLMDQLHEELKEPVVAVAAALTEARDSVDARDRVARPERTGTRRRQEKPCWAGGLLGWGAETARTRSAFRSEEPYFWEGTGNCQSAREGAHRRRVMSADQLLANKDGLLLEKVAAAKATAAPRSLGGEGQVGEGRRDGCGSGS